jgi:hypothetical protein
MPRITQHDEPAAARRAADARQASVPLSVIREIRGVSDPAADASPDYRFEDETRRLGAGISAAGIARPA